MNGDVHTCLKRAASFSLAEEAGLCYRGLRFQRSGAFLLCVCTQSLNYTLAKIRMCVPVTQANQGIVSGDRMVWVGF